MKRRDLLQYVSAAGAMCLTENIVFVRAAIAQSCGSDRLPGVQLYTVRELLSADPAATFMSLAALGLREVELFGLDAARTVEDQLFGMTSRQFRSALEAAGLQMSIAHIWGNWRDTAGHARLAEDLQLDTVVLGLPEIFTETRDGVFNMIGARNLADVTKLTDELNDAGARYRSHGLTFAYHNHHVEFIPVEGNVPYDYILNNTDANLVGIELDVGWVAAAGLNPADVIRRHSNRIVSCHLKDFDSRVSMPDVPHHQTILTAVVEPGAGTIDYTDVLNALAEARIRHGFIEIDVVAEPLTAIERGHQFLQQLQGCTGMA